MAGVAATAGRETGRLGRTIALVVVLALALAFMVPVAGGDERTDQAWAQTSGRDGPVILVGIDAEDGGVGGHGPISNYIQLVGSVLAEVSNGARGGVLVVGGGKSAGDDVTSFWNAVSDGVGVEVTYVNGAADIAAQSFSGFEVIAVVSGQLNTRRGGLTSAENQALAARSTDVANFVNLGGGLLGFEQEGFDVPFGYVGALGDFSISRAFYSAIDPTPGGEAVGLTTALNVCCWHNLFNEYPDFLDVLAYQAGTDRVAAIGGRVFVPPPGIPDGQTTGECSGPNGHASSGNGECFADPVNMATGTFELAEHDLELAGIGLGFAMTRYYSSADAARAGPLGPGWTHELAANLEVNEDEITFRAEDGQRIVYTEDGAGGYTSGPGVRSQLSESDEGYTLVRPDQVTYDFDDEGRLRTLADRSDNRLVLSYDGAGDLKSVTDTVGREITFSHADERLRSVELPDGRSVEYDYTDGLLTRVEDPSGEQTTYGYDGDDRLEHIVDATGARVVHNTYGEDGRVIEQIDALGHHSFLAWDEDEQTTTVTVPGGSEWSYTYANNLLVEATAPDGSSVRYDYDADANPRVVIDRRGHTTLLDYDTRGNVIGVTAPEPFEYVQSYEYDEANNLVRATDGRGNTTELVYDENGNLAATHEPGGVTTQFVRDPEDRGLLIELLDAQGGSTTFDYDEHGNLASVTSPEGHTTTMAYDDSGRLTRVTDPRADEPGTEADEYTTRYAYAPTDRLVAVTDALGHTTSFEHDPVGQLVARTDADGQRTSYEYDAARRLVEVVAADGAPTSYTYDAVGNVVARVDANGNTTNYTFDEVYRLTGVRTPTGARWSYEHDANGNLTQVTDANAHEASDPALGTTSYTYDALNRLVSIEHSDGTPDVQLTYDANGNRTEMSDGAGHVEYAYDARDRLVEVVRGGEGFAYEYDDADNVTARHYPDGTTVVYDHDRDGRLAAVTEDDETTRYGYDAAGNVVTTSLPNGQTGRTAFDEAGRIAAHGWSDDTAALSDLRYELDALGRPTSVHDVVDDTTVTYGYDVRDQLIEACYDADCRDFLRYDYDPVGNRLAEERPEGNTSLRYDEDDRLLTVDGPDGSVTYAHDANGNRRAEGDRTYTYDLANRLVEIHEGGGAPAAAIDGGVTHSLAIDAAGAVKAWGGNAAGQLGDGTTTPRALPGIVAGLSAIAVAAGGNHSLAITSGDEVRAWGANDRGQLGNDATEVATEPVKVDGLQGISAIAGGAFHSLALDRDGTVWSWGHNATGQLGDGETTDRAAPAPLADLPTITDIDAGGLPTNSGHSLALAEDGTVWAWGQNNRGQLGDGTRTDRHRPVPVDGLDDVVAIAAGGESSYALDADGKVWAWGDHRSGQLGTTEVRDNRSEEPVEVDLTDATAIAAGGTHALAVTEDGTALAWGNNNSGQLAQGDSTPGASSASETPVRVAGIDAASTVAAGHLHSFAVLEDASPWAWGRNSDGQLGDGTSDSDRGGGPPSAGRGAERDRGDRTTSTTPAPVEIADLDMATSAPSPVAAYRYDGDGTRIESVVDGAATSWQWDVNAPMPLLVGERDADDQQIDSYTYGHELLAQTDGSGDSFYYHHDHVGSVTHLTDADGVAQQHYAYEPFGALRQEDQHTPGDVVNPMRFTGQYQDDESDLYHLRARQYDPGTGNFLTVDPLAQTTGDPYVTPYSYTANRPTVMVDPLGLCSVGSVRIGFLSNDDNSCRGAGVLESARDVADTGVAQTVKRVTGTVSGVTAGAAAVTGTVSLACPLPCGPITAPVTAGLLKVSAGTGAVSLGITCLDRQSSPRACPVGAATTLLVGVGGHAINNVVVDPLARAAATGQLALFGTAVNQGYARQDGPK